MSPDQVFALFVTASIIGNCVLFVLWRAAKEKAEIFHGMWLSAQYRLEQSGEHEEPDEECYDPTREADWWKEGRPPPC